MVREICEKVLMKLYFIMKKILWKPIYIVDSIQALYKENKPLKSGLLNLQLDEMRIENCTSSGCTNDAFGPP